MKRMIIKMRERMIQVMMVTQARRTYQGGRVTIIPPHWIKMRMRMSLCERQPMPPMVLMFEVNIYNYIMISKGLTWYEK